MFAAAHHPAARSTAAAVRAASSSLGQRPPAHARRRSGGAGDARHWLAAALDELDYGIVLLSDGMRIVHINEAAQTELDDDHPLQRVGSELRARLARDVAPLHEALTAAAAARPAPPADARRGARTAAASRSSRSTAPAPVRAPSSSCSASARVCESLSIQGFARSCGLTGAETRVLAALCSGVPPAEVAERARRRRSRRCAARSAACARRPAPPASARWCASWRCCRR